MHVSCPSKTTQDQGERVKSDRPTLKSGSGSYQWLFRTDSRLTVTADPREEGGRSRLRIDSRMKKSNPQKSRPKIRSKGNQNIAGKDGHWGKTCPLSPMEGAPWLSVDEKIYQWDLAEAVDNGERFSVANAFCRDISS